ncbi:MAG: hypothetical protein FWE53_05135 [Firmicutes bacterium]|nr:hypothetical protein [Bacillota bacterium]
MVTRKFLAKDAYKYIKEDSVYWPHIERMVTEVFMPANPGCDLDTEYMLIKDESYKGYVVGTYEDGDPQYFAIQKMQNGKTGKYEPVTVALDEAGYEKFKNLLSDAETGEITQVRYARHKWMYSVFGYDVDTVILKEFREALSGVEIVELKFNSEKKSRDFQVPKGWCDVTLATKFEPENMVKNPAAVSEALSLVGAVADCHDRK